MSKKIILDGVKIDQDSLPYVIAEIGHNHQGSVKKCKELFIKAKNAGANAVKLKKEITRNYIQKNFILAPMIILTVMEILMVSTESN